MPKRKPSRRRRRGARPQQAPSVAAPTRHVAPAVAVATAGQAPEAPTAREPSVTRLTTRDFSYVRREIRSILILAGAILITIVVLSFFLP